LRRERIGERKPWGGLNRDMGNPEVKPDLTLYIGN
jgi:hypothetical protein